jgi:serine/threonine protein kinase
MFTSMEELVGRQFGPYRIDATLGQGGMATVYKAYQPAVDRYVAIKILPRHFSDDPQYLGRFRHEAKIVAQLQHPHILPVFDFGERDGYTFLAMPFVHGGTLADTCQGPVAPAVAERIISQICAALKYAHAKGVIHRDLKPSNILIDESGNCLVADFGIAHLDGDATKLTATGAVMGTPAYMAPEQAAGADVGPQSDVYSVGIMLYEMLTGRVPFKAETPLAVAIQHLTAPLPPPRSFNAALTPAVEAVVLKALARSKEDRFSSAEEFATAFGGAVSASQVMQRMETIVGPAATPEVGATLSTPGSQSSVIDTRRTSRVPGYLVVASLAIVAAGAYFWIATWRSPASTAVESAAAQPPNRVAEAPAAPTAPAESPTAERAAPKPAAPEAPSPRSVAAKPPTAEPPSKTESAKPPTPPTTEAIASAPADNVGRSIAQYQRSCDDGRPVGCANLGMLYLNGTGVPQDEVRAAGLFQRACDGGHLLGCAQLGVMYKNGTGVLNDDRKAFALFERSCDAGNGFGCLHLGDMYASGRGVTTDFTKAIASFQKACDAGNAMACKRVRAVSVRQGRRGARGR